MKPAVPSNPTPLKSLDRSALSLLLEEDASTEYCLVAHNRQVQSIEVGVWSLQLPKSTKPVASQLRSLDLSFNCLHHLGAQSLAPLHELRDLKLYANKLTDEGLMTCGLEKLGRLENLELHDNRLRQPPPSVMSGCTKLQSLRLERNQLETLQNLGKCRSLTSLNVDGNRLHRLTEPNGTPWLVSCISLEMLSIGDNDIDKISPKAFNGCKKLTELVLCRNCLKGDSLVSLTPLADTLRRLRLEGNHMVSLSKLPQMNKLEELNVSNNRLTTGALDSIAKRLPQIEILDLVHNRLEGDVAVVIGEALVTCATLKELSCEGNPCCASPEWWPCLAKMLPQLDLLDDRKVTRISVENGVAIPTLALTQNGARPTSARPLSARPTSARPLSARLGTPRGGGTTPRSGEGGGQQRPVMHPPSRRTGYGTELKIDTLEDVEALAKGFRRRVSSMRHNIRPSSATPQVVEGKRKPRIARQRVSSSSSEEVVDRKASAKDDDDGGANRLQVEVSSPKMIAEKKLSLRPSGSPLSTVKSEGSKRSQLNKALGFAAKDENGGKRGAVVFGDLSEPPPPPRMLKPWEQGGVEESTAEAKDTEQVPLPSDMKLDLNTIRLSSGENSFVDIPQPSPRYQRESTVDRRAAPSANERKAALKKFTIPTQARKQLSASPR